MTKVTSAVASTTVSELKAAREQLATVKTLVKTLAEKAKAEKEATKVARTQARETRMAERKAKLKAALAKLENVGKGAAKAKAAVRKPGPVQVIKPAE